MSAPHPDWYLKLVDSLRSFPFWVLSSLTIFSCITAFVPEVRVLLPAEFVNYAKLSAIFFSVFSVCSLGNKLFNLFGMRHGHKTFHMTPVHNANVCMICRQPDGSYITDVRLELVVKNMTNNDLHLLSFAVPKPKINGEILGNLITIKSLQDDFSGITGIYSSIPKQSLMRVGVFFQKRGIPKQTTGTIRATVAIKDSEGNEQRTKIDLKCVVPQVAA